MEKDDFLMRFSDIPSNKNVKNQLIRSLTIGRLSHAHLFIAEDGSANLSMALAFCQFLLCQNKLDNDSCGECSSCLKSEKFIHPDVHFIFPVTTSKSSQAISEDYLDEWRIALSKNPFMSEQDWYLHLGARNKQGFISAHEAKSLSRKLSLKPYENSYRIILIWQADKMHHAAANKLLKVLEEPPQNTIFILLSSSQELLLETIVSRLQCISIDSCSENELISYLINQFDINENKAQEISAMSEGNIGKAIQLTIGSELLEQNTVEFQNLMRLCYQAKIEQLSDWVETISRWGREVHKEFLNYALRMIRECLVYNFSDGTIQQLRHEELAFVKNFAPFIHQQNMGRIIEELEKAHHHISRNGSPKFIFMDLALKLTVFLHAKKLTLQESINT